MKKTILIVDKDQTVLGRLSRSLSRWFEVQCVGSNGEALAELGRHSYDVVLVDETTPFLREMRHSGFQTPCVLLTAQSFTNADRAAYLQNDRCVVFEKPWDVLTLLDALSSAATVRRIERRMEREHV